MDCDIGEAHEVILLVKAQNVTTSIKALAKQLEQRFKKDKTYEVEFLDLVLMWIYMLLKI